MRRHSVLRARTGSWCRQLCRPFRLFIVTRRVSVGSRACPRLAALLAALLVVGGARADEPAPIPQPSIALFYGASVPVDQLAPFDTVVIEPDSGFDPTAHTAGS